jgi:hypothetical protein
MVKEKSLILKYFSGAFQGYPAGRFETELTGSTSDYRLNRELP